MEGRPISRARVIQPIIKQIVVHAPQATAFEAFTSGMTSWWDRGYRIGAEPIATVVVEPQVGGRWFEQGESGAQCDWGHVLVWDPPHRVVFTWQITADWRFDAELVTELELRFTPEGPSSTQVDLEHRGLEALGDQGDDVRRIFDSPGGWAGLLGRFEAATT